MMSRTSGGTSRVRSTAAASFSDADSVMSQPGDGQDERDRPAKRYADRVCDHVEHLESAIVGHALEKFHADAQRDEPGGVVNSGLHFRIELAEPEHQAAVGEEMPELVALLEIERWRRGRER